METPCLCPSEEHKHGGRKQGSYPFLETNFKDFSRTQIDFSKALKFILTPLKFTLTPSNPEVRQVKLQSRLTCSQKLQKCKFVPRLLSMIVNISYGILFRFLASKSGAPSHSFCLLCLSITCGL